eukprot:2527575-Amphidinium_carterae.1
MVRTKQDKQQAEMFAAQAKNLRGQAADMLATIPRDVQKAVASSVEEPLAHALVGVQSLRDEAQSN